MLKYRQFVNRAGVYLLSLVITLAAIPAHGSSTLAESNENAGEESDDRAMSYALLPIISYSPETRLMLGTAVFITNTRADSTEMNRPSSIMPSAMYTQNKQSTVQLDFDHYWNQGTRRTFGKIAFKKFPDRFYGIGNDLPDEYEMFTPRITLLNVNYQHGITGDLNLGGGFRFEKTQIVEAEPGRLIDSQSVPGAEGGQTIGISLFTNRDTRDHTQYPTAGCYIELGLKQFSDALGSDFSFSDLSLDARYYIPLTASQVLAFQMQFSDINGTAPFQSLSTLGGEVSMRGYYTGRFRHNDKVILQGEYRLRLTGKYGLVFFACLGEVNSTFSAMRLSDFKYSAGFGFRYLLIPEAKANLRIDFGYGKGTSGINIGFSEAF